jgi:hypothetical protein
MNKAVLPVLEGLLRSEEPSIRYKARMYLLGEDPACAAMQTLRQEIRSSHRVRRLLSECRPDGTIPFHPYLKWRGAHWVLSLLAELEYPPGDASLAPLREQVYQWLLSREHEKHIRLIQGRIRRCASQEGNAAYSLLKLGLADERTKELIQRLLKWQWPDGGWNCDKRPQAHNSSYYESWLPLRALNLYFRQTDDRQVRPAIDRAAELLLKRNLFLGIKNGEPIKPDFIQVSFPYFFFYNILSALQVMMEIRLLHDSRCQRALDLLSTKQLPDGSFPSEVKYYRVTSNPISRTSTIDWGPCGPRKANEFVTLKALIVLKAAGRL